ncbi:MAG: GspE/PulE family protein [bacterium]|nr:GspE/PulE family protein [bacterium]MDA1024398.1 GspE/PulE family protein [bacterium]
MSLLSEEQYKKALVTSGAVTEETFTAASETAKKEQKDLYTVLVESDALEDRQIGQLIADMLSVPFLELADFQVDRNVLRLIPESFARANHVFPLQLHEGFIRVATSHPGDLETKSLLEKFTRHEIRYVFVTPRDLTSHYHLFEKDAETVLADYIERAGGKDIDASGQAVIQLVEELIERAYQARASDVHIEPEDEETLVRFRVDGLLHDVVTVPKKLHDHMVTRIKVLSRLPTDEHQSALDGKISYESKRKEDIEIRVSIVPVTDGEKVVMRLLSERSRQFSLRDLGFHTRELDLFADAIKKPWGMILVTGPTGSGKTTTLYAGVKMLNKRNVNISTIEDPVEYDIDGVNQIQVNEKTKLTFAKGLRSIVRQDPDIIMVGEIRDSETADIAVNAALTGHLVLSTLHTNNAATAFPRLRDMSVEEFLISSTMIGVVAQRLVRQLCRKCLYSKQASAEELQLIESRPEVKAAIEKQLAGRPFAELRLFHAKGCPVCGQTGFRGRVGIFEILEVTDAVRVAIMQQKNSDEIQEVAIQEGMVTMLQHGVEQALAGVTALEEVLRVTK